LTSLGIYIDVYEDDIQRPLLPGSAAALTGIRQLDINDDTMRPEIMPALTGTHIDAISCTRIGACPGFLGTGKSSMAGPAFADTCRHPGLDSARNAAGFSNHKQHGRPDQVRAVCVR
jgi:hypothetical protein